MFWVHLNSCLDDVLARHSVSSPNLFSLAIVYVVMKGFVIKNGHLSSLHGLCQLLLFWCARVRLVVPLPLYSLCYQLAYCLPNSSNGAEGKTLRKTGEDRQKNGPHWLCFH